MSQALPVEAIAVRLADEGVPLRAIARATKTPSDTLRDRLEAAIADGRLLELPHDDWPPGFPRDQRSLQLSRMVVENREAVMLAMQQLFGLTGTEVGMLMTMLHNISVPKDMINATMTPRTIYVHMFHIRRRLAPFGVSISTLWGYGYQLSVESRRKIMDLLLSHVAQSGSGFGAGVEA